MNISLYDENLELLYDLHCKYLNEAKRNSQGPEVAIFQVKLRSVKTAIICIIKLGLDFTNPKGKFLCS